MLYRFRFDGYVGGILKNCGLGTSSALTFWPAGSTAQWVKIGQDSGWEPIEAAAMAVTCTALHMHRQGEMRLEHALYMCRKAADAARSKGAAPALLAQMESTVREAVHESTKAPS
jgi:hypothetical protein